VGESIGLYVDDSSMFFGGASVSESRTPYTILGVPFDYTTTYKPGARFAPRRIREAAANIEFYSFRTHLDFNKVMFHDMGDLSIVPGDVKSTLYRLREFIKDVRVKKRIPIIIGGEHTISIGAIEGFADLKPYYVVFDAHFDLRDEYNGSKWTHASTLRRIVEILGSKRVIVVGVRAACSEELEYVRSMGIEYITSHQILKYGVKRAISKIIENSKISNSLYISIDMDVFDPAYAPGVGNPEPEGLTPTHVLDILYEIVDERLVGFDVVEVCPLCDVNDITSILAAKVIIELSSIHYIRTFKT